MARNKKKKKTKRKRLHEARDVCMFEEGSVVVVAVSAVLSIKNCMTHENEQSLEENKGE